MESVTSDQDLVLLDVGLPDVNGLEVASEICGRFSGKRPVLAALTGYGQENDRN
jgi:DNA-binding response OmpR family regulator